MTCLQRSIEPCKKALADAGIDASKIDEVVLVGGQTRMPRIQEIVKHALRQGAPQGRQPGRSGCHRSRGAGGRTGR